MKILHTADLHLREHGDERWKTLLGLIEIGNREKVNIFVISGDLFDKGINAENLRPKIREIFSKNPFKIIITPGNHDANSYEPGIYFGENTEILTNPSVPFELQDVRIFGVPFEPMDRGEVLNRILSLRELLRDDKSNILVYHGELLDAFFSREDFGEEGKERHMPLKLSYFEGLNVDYVLAGHFHTKFNVRRLENGGYFIYPGSPISITKKERGRRKANVFNVGKPPAEYSLDTPHFEEVDLALDPSISENPLETLRKRLKGLHPAAKILLTVGGYINSDKMGMTEIQLVSKIRELTLGRLAEEPHFEFRDIKKVLENGLFRRFSEKLEQAGHGEEKAKLLREIAIKAMVGAKYES